MTMTGAQKRQLQEAITQPEEQIIQAIITARGKAPEERMEQVLRAQERSFIQALFKARKEAPEEQPQLLDVFLAVREQRIILALITTREGEPNL